MRFSMRITGFPDGLPLSSPPAPLPAPASPPPPCSGGDKFSVAFARIENHYFVNKGFFEQDDQLLAGAHALSGIPTVIVQGRYDMVCPMDTAWELKQRMPHAQWVLVPDAGHSAWETGIQAALLDATDKFRPAK